MRTRAEHEAGPLSLLLTAAIAGLAIGVLEVAIVLGHEISHNLTRTSFHVLWMAPLADLALAVATGAVVHGAGRFAPRLCRRSSLLGIFLGLAAFVLLLTIQGLHPLASAVLAAGLGGVTWRLGRPLDARLPVRATRLTSILVLGCFLAGILSALLPPIVERRALAALPSPPDGVPNVLLIILDTVRAKSLGLYGRERDTSSRLDALAADGVAFERAISTAPWTLPSHASIFTGQPPFRLSTAFDRPLDDTYPTLGEELSRQGFATAGFTANLLYTSRGFGLSRGFGHYEDYPVSLGQMVLSTSWGRRLAGWSGLRNLLGHHELLNRKSAASVIDDFFAWVDRDHGRPFFVFLNLYDAHEPYIPPEPYDRLFHPPSSRGPMRHVVSLRGGIEAVRPEKWEMTAADQRLDLALYEGAIAYMDHQLGRLFAGLERRGLWDGTLVIVSSDHGEQFGEHGLYRHINSVYMPLLHVPLILHLPGRIPRGVRVTAPVSLSQLPATIMDLIELVPTVEFPGPSLVETWTVGAVARPPPPFSELVPGIVEQSWYPIAAGRLRSIVSGTYHYIRDERGVEELYDLAADPDETTDLAADPSHAETLRALRSQLDEIVADREATPRLWIPRDSTG